jgi:hypothetical protein
MQDDKNLFKKYENDIATIFKKLELDKSHNYKTIFRLIELKEILKEFDLMEELEKSEVYETYKKHKLLEIDLEFMKKFKSIYPMLDCLIKSRNISKIEHWRKQILDKLTELNMYEQFMKMESHFLKCFQLLLGKNTFKKTDENMDFDL